MLKTNTQIPFKDIAALWIKKKETSTNDVCKNSTMIPIDFRIVKY